MSANVAFGHRRYAHHLNGLGEVLPAVAPIHGSKLALVCDDRSFSYRELQDAASAVASGLRVLGVREGDRVSLFSQNRWEWVVSYHAILQCGAVVNPLNVMLTAAEFEYAVSDAGSKVVIASAERLDEVADAVQRIDAVQHLVCFEGSRPGALAFSELVARDPGTFQPVEVAPDALACIAYTSGTTGRPKGAMQSQRSLVLNCAYTAAMHARSEADTVLTALPATHVYGNVVMNATFLSGGTLVLMRRFDARLALELIAKHRVTMVDGVPAMYALLISEPSFARADLSTITKCTVGGQTISQSVVERWEAATGAPLVELWGMTEIAGLGLTHSMYAPNVHGSIGVAIPSVEAQVADLRDPARRCGAHEPGELLVRGPIVMQGYFNNPDATAAAIDEEGWLHTGDVATHDGTGHFFITDRLGDMIVTGGYNVYPAEIERVMMSHEQVSLVAVGRAPDEVKGEVAHAYVVSSAVTESNEERQAVEQSILEHARSQLAAYKVPRALHFVNELPTTSSGKIMRRALRPPADD